MNYRNIDSLSWLFRTEFLPCFFSKFNSFPLPGGWAYEVLNYRITVDFFENYRNTVINFLYKYRHRSIFYQNLYIFHRPC